MRKRVSTSGIVLRSLSAMLVLALAGCASIPTTGAVYAGVALPDTNSIEVDILARGPQDGDSQEQILQGFLAAAASPKLDYAVAREFLTSDFSKTWKPDSSATVDQSADRSTSATSDASIALRIKPMATVSDEGVYTTSQSGSAETRNFSFTQVNGQWRISQAPQGIVIDQPTFGIVFGSYSLQFFSPDWSYFVPDLRWFARRETTQTAIVRALITGPTSWLKPGVISAIPEGASLEADSVPLTGSTATVNLAVQTVPTSEQLSRIQAQIQSSLIGLSGVSTVQLAINGTDENVATLVPMPTTPIVDSRPAVLTSNAFGYLSTVSAQVQPFSGISDAVVKLAPSAAALGVNASMAAALTSVGIYRVTAQGSAIVWAGSGWLAPTVDPGGGIWTSRAGKVEWQGSDGGQAEFDPGWNGSTATALAVSRDGTRIAAVVNSGGVERIVVNAIARGGDGSPTGLGSAALVANLDGAAASLSWNSSIGVSALTANSDAFEVVSANVGGQSTSLNAPSASTAVSVGNGTREIRVLTGNGTLQQAAGTSWQERATQILVLSQQPVVR